MSKKPLLLDVYSGAGGCSYGYHLAGFDVVGCDIVPMPRYPFTFHRDDALNALDMLLSGRARRDHYLEDFAAIHASPECKGYTNCNLSPREQYEKQIVVVRERLKATNKPYIIENVKGARKHLHGSLKLCGTMFGLPMLRERIFESNVFLYPPAPCNHSIAHIAVYGHSVWDSWLTGTPRKDGRPRPDSVPLEVGRAAMGIPWMGIEELAEAIPPAYTEWIGNQLLAYIEQMQGESVA